MTSDSHATGTDTPSSPTPELRTPEGRFAKGVSGNPGGKRAGTAAVRRLIRGMGEDLVLRLFEIAFSHDLAAANSAIKELMNRGYGKSKEHLEVGITHRNPQVVMLRHGSGQPLPPAATRN